jgi:predicted nucleic acid-binding protein
VIFVDSNVPMYLIGDDQARKAEAWQAIERVVVERRPLVTSSEVLQEILHRYSSGDRRRQIEPAFDLLREIVDEVLPVEEVDVLAAKDLLLRQASQGISARDALHVSVMHHHAIEQVLSFDRGFDAVSGIARLPTDRSAG